MPWAVKIIGPEGDSLGGSGSPLVVDGAVEVTEVSAPLAFYAGQLQITAATPQALSASSVPLTAGRIEISHHPNNDPNSLLYIFPQGNNSSSSRVLAVGDVAVVLVDNLNKVFVDTSISDSVATWQAS